MRASSGGRGGSKWWLIGCGGLLGVVVLTVIAIAGLTWRATAVADPQKETMVYDEVSAPMDVRTTEPDAALSRGVGVPATILLEIDSAELIVEPAAPGEALSIEAHYDTSDYRLEENLDDQNPWSYRMRFLVSGSRLITGIKQGIHGGQPQVRVRLPLDVPLDLKVVQRNGGAIIDLSGLHLRTAEFDFEGALLKVDADEPLDGTLERFTVRGSSGGVFLESLNLMAPEQLELDFKMGQILVDMRGPWDTNTALALESSLADITLRLPREARIEGLDGLRSASPAAREIPLPTLTFVLTPGRRSKLRVFE
jgi:hypothetical protein